MKNYIKKAKKLGRKLVETYREYRAEIEIVDCKIIPSLLRYIFTVEPSPGTKVQTILDCAKDVRFALGLHLVYPFEEDGAIKIAVSKHEVKENRLLKILRSLKFSNSNKKIPLALGYDLMGNMHIADLAELLHLLIVGPSGTGKSVAIQCIVLSIITRCSADSVKLLLFDIGANSLSLFDGVSHLYHPTVKDTDEAILVLESLVAEMDERIALGEAESLPFIVCIVDEFDDTISNIDNEDKDMAKRFIAAINSIIRRGRKAKVGLILASHDPTLRNTKVNINGIVPRIVFQLSKHNNSSTALGVTGAQDLPRRGAMLFKSQEGIKYLQGSYVTEPEIERILKDGPVDYDGSTLKLTHPETVHLSEAEDGAPDSNAGAKKANQELADITVWTLRCKTASSRAIQEKYSMSKRADGIMDKLVTMGIISVKHSNQPRKVLPQMIEEVPPETLEFLERYGYTSDDVADAIAARSTDNCGTEPIQ